MIKRIDVKGVAGNPIRVLLIPKGNKCPYIISDIPCHVDTVQFYDLKYTENFTPDGQYIGAYYSSTLIEKTPNTGLDLYGSEPSWKINASTFSLIQDWLLYHTT
jgi:hypothetical protein